MERLLADAADHVHVDRFRALGELRESRLGSSAAHGGQRNGGGQEILLQDGSPGWFDSPSLSDGQRLLPDRSEEHTSELQSLMRISYAVFCLKKKNIKHNS